MVAGRSGLYCRKCEKSHSLPNLTKIGLRLMKAQVWPVATYGSESWTLRKNEESGAENSCLAFSTLAFWCRIFMSRNFMSRIFSVPVSGKPEGCTYRGAPKTGLLDYYSRFFILYSSPYRKTWRL